MLRGMNLSSLVEPLMLPPRLVVRALDDLHTIAAASRNASVRLESMQERTDVAVVLLGRIEYVGDQVLAMGARIETQAEQVLAMGARIETQTEQLLALGESFDKLGAAVLEQGKVLEITARELATRGSAVTDALPTLERAVAIVEPLEGAVERLGRIADLLPGGQRRSGAPPRRGAR